MRTPRHCNPDLADSQPLESRDLPAFGHGPLERSLRRALRHEWEISYLRDGTVVGAGLVLIPMLAWLASFLHAEYLIIFGVPNGIPALSWLLERPVLLMAMAFTWTPISMAMAAWRRREEFSDESLARERQRRWESQARTRAAMVRLRAERPQMTGTDHRTHWAQAFLSQHKDAP